MSQYPISKVCPKCGNGEFRRRKSEEIVAFTSDRLCMKCETRYTPPTPAWAGLLFIVIGLLMAPFFGFFLFGHLINFNVIAFPSTMLVAIGFIVGLFALWHGIRVLIRPGRV